MACRRCAKCCRNWAIPVPNDTEDIRFLLYHGLIVRQRQADGRMEVYGESKCNKLRSDGKGGYKCSIYETRPRLCRTWLCDEARKGE